ncbi:MAG: hypothetical protein EOM87_00715 [Clostridia bacterium]|nr:hypothetical protein [Clostridia bacterium]
MYILSDITDIFTNFDINKIFTTLSIEQIIAFGAVVVFSVLAGLFLGGICFYLSGVRKGKKLVRFKKTIIPTAADEAYYTTEEDSLDKIFDSDELNSALITTKPDNAIFGSENVQPIFDEVDLVVLFDDTVEQKDNLVDESKVRPQAASLVLDDDNFMRIRAERKAKVPVLTREEVLSYVTSLSGYGNVIISRRKDFKPYDRCYLGDCTFLIVLERKEAIKLIIRLHPKSVAALQAKAPGHVEKFEALGNDWYSWVVSDIENNNIVVATSINMAYKYVSNVEYEKNANGEFVLHNAELASTKEDLISAVIREYKVEKDEVFVSISDMLNEKYHLDYFSKSEICKFARTIKGLVPASAQDRPGYRPATLKAGERIYSIVFEKSGIVKIIFRADEEYVEHLKIIHPYVTESPYPASRDWTWYSAIIDDTFTEDSVKSMLIESFNHVAKIHLLDKPKEGANIANMNIKSKKRR